MVSRRLTSQFALLIGVAMLVFTLSISGVAGSDATTGGDSGTPAALAGGSSSVIDEDQGTTGQTQLGSTENTPIPTPTPTPTTTTEDESGTLPENNLDEGGDTGTAAQTGESEGLTQETEESAGSEGSPVVEIAEEPVLHAVLVTVFNCATSPDAAPQDHADCTVAESAAVVVQVDSVEVGNQLTDENGQVTFDLEEGATAVISQSAATIPGGFSPRGDGAIEILVEGSSEVQLVNLADLLTQGRFQISNQQCFASGEPYTEFLPVIGPMVRAASADCTGPVPGAAYTVTGGSLAEPLVLTTDGSGGWTGYLDAGDYTISRAGASTGFTIEVNQITVVLTVDWVTGAKGTVSVQRYTCTEGDVSGTSITLYDGGGGVPPNESCVASEANVQLFSADSTAEPLNLNGNGTEVQVAAGDYVVRDISGVEQALTVTGNGFIQALIAETRLTGVVSAQINICADPASNFEDPTQPGYWSSNCGPAAPGTNVALLDTAGNIVASTETDGGGSAYFEDILAGTYVLDVQEACALFAGGNDARAGFTVAPNQVVNVAAYECAKPPSQNPPGGGGNNGGGGTQTGGNSGGDGSPSVGSLPDQLFSLGDSRPEAAPAQNSELFVTTLPAIGTGQAAGGNQWTVILLLAAVAGFSAIRMVAPTSRTMPVRSRR